MSTDDHKALIERLRTDEAPTFPLGLGRKAKARATLIDERRQAADALESLTKSRSAAYDRVSALLSADPLCMGRVTPETVEAIASGGEGPGDGLPDLGNMPIACSDPIVEAVRADLAARSARGLAKYGVTLARSDLTEHQWMQHHYEELLDAALYVRRQMFDLDDKLAGQA